MNDQLAIVIANVSNLTCTLLLINFVLPLEEQHESSKHELVTFQAALSLVIIHTHYAFHNFDSKKLKDNVTTVQVHFKYIDAVVLIQKGFQRVMIIIIFIVY